ncbi:MAG TPA: WS/DGAT domain-containing protein [Motilibacterales bacterium]|nr:WS/DGAT domain-containing protein [Motilibacterales bacterium]
MTEHVALSPNDSLWLNMDSPENLMVIEGVMWFDEPLEADAATRAIQERMVDRYPVFTWRPEHANVGLDHWVEDPDFDISRHITHHQLDGDGGREAMRAYMEARMSEPLPRDRPLWQAHVLTGNDFGAVMMRFHHAIADGTALVRVLLDLTTDTPTGDAQPEDAVEALSGSDPRSHPAESSPTTGPVPNDRDHPGLRDRAGRRLFQLATFPLTAGVAATNSAVNLVHMLDPEHQGSLTWRVADQVAGTADAVDKLIIGTHDDILLFGQPGLDKLADWTPTYDLDDVKQVAKARGATVNDVMIAALAGALRRYVLARGEVPRDVVTMIPVNLRAVDEPLPIHLGNKFALVAIELPLSEPTPMARLRASKARMDVIKSGPEALLTFGLSHAIGVMGSVTESLSRRMTQFFSNKAIGVTTNVPGPSEVRYFAGQEMVGILGWVPGASHQTLGACIFSYNAMIRVGFKTDANVIPDVGNLVSAFNDEMADLFAEGSAV